MIVEAPPPSGTVVCRLGSVSSTILFVLSDLELDPKVPTHHTRCRNAMHR